MKLSSRAPVQEVVAPAAAQQQVWRPSANVVAPTTTQGKCWHPNTKVFLRMPYLELQTSDLNVLGVLGNIRKRSTMSLLKEKPSLDLNGSSVFALQNDMHDVDFLNVDSFTLDSSLCMDSSCIDISYVDSSTVDIDTSHVDSFAIDSLTDDDSYIVVALHYTSDGDCNFIDIISGLALEFGIAPDFSFDGHSFTCDTSALYAICTEINNAIIGTTEVAISNDPLVGDALVDTTLIDHAILEDVLPIVVSVPKCALTDVKPPFVQEDISFTCVYNRLYLELQTLDLDVLGVPGKIRKRSRTSLLDEKPSSDVKDV
ncbi:hypothetical protein Fmac_011224 [Flemingia macrophylla]|uniref:Uncharacterized protein n=1 Tax=Flemingia macrophylla TaxID=520843 RepID=A0ABD1MLT3_9FABA